jgi:hypothetical protein
MTDIRAEYAALQTAYDDEEAALLAKGYSVSPKPGPILQTGNFPVQVPARLFQVFQRIPLLVPLLAGAGDILGRVPQAEAKAPRLYDLDGFVRVVRATVVFGVIDGLMI